jgi:lipopolysaccharide transport system permease protein
LLKFRNLWTRFVSRDLKLRYRQTLLAVGWVVLQPLLAAGVFSFVFGRVAGLSLVGVPYVTVGFSNDASAKSARLRAKAGPFSSFHTA